MEQKTTWIISLIIGAFFLLAFSCNKDEPDEPIQKATYIYLNKLTDTVRFELYKSEDKSSIEYDLAEGDSITFVFSGTPGVFPFYGDEASNRVGDSVKISFNDGNCTGYKRSKATGTFGGTGVFDRTLYENYRKELVSRNSYTLRYPINEKDYLKSEPCKP